VTLGEESGVTPYFLSTGTNSRSRTDRGKAFSGWTPREEGLWEGLAKDLDATLLEY
jgi:hypothetical protein